MIRDVYLNNESLSNNTVLEYGQLFSDSHIVYGVTRFTNLIRRYKPVYNHIFDYKGIYTEATWNVGYKVDTGVVHADELQYIFTTNVAPVYSQGTKEYQIVELMTKVWINFAKFG